MITFKGNKMITFRQYLNEIKVSGTHATKYFGLIKKALKSKTMETNFDQGVLEVQYDNLSLYFKDSYLVGFKDDEGEYYEVSKNLKSIKDLKTERDFQKAFGRKVRDPKQMNKPKEPVYAYFPTSGTELKDLTNQLIRERGNNADLNDIDVSNVEDMESMFEGSRFNGDISKWDVSNVKDMSYMFGSSKFNGDISKWNVSNVSNMTSMFEGSKFNGDISKWNVSNVKNIQFMFADSKFNGDISKWNVSNVESMFSMFRESPLESKYGANGEAFN